MKNYPFVLRGSLLFMALSFSSLSLSSQDEFKTVEEVKGLEVGTLVPDFNAVNQFDEVVSFEKLLENGPIVLVFYRGVWCPLCNRHLAELQESFRQIEGRGAQIVAVSPERPEFLRQTAEKTGAGFTLLYDEDYRISQLFDLTFLPDEETLKMLADMLNADLTKPHSDDSQRLPVPATFIINSDREIVWRHFDPDYRNRSGVDEILENLPTDR